MLTPSQATVYEKFLTLQRVVDRSLARCRAERFRGYDWRNERNDACAAEVIVAELLQSTTAIPAWSSDKRFSVSNDGESATIGPLGFKKWPK